MNSEATKILEAIIAGDPLAAEDLLPLVYDELRRLAEHRLAREAPGNTLQATALVHEAYIRLLGPDGEALGWDGTKHFFAAAAEAMRRILIDRARARGAIKRGGEFTKLSLDSVAVSLDEHSQEILQLDEAVARLRSHDARKAELVKLRFFAGLTMQQAADILDISLATAERDWGFARAWLYRELTIE